MTLDRILNGFTKVQNQLQTFIEKSEKEALAKQGKINVLTGEVAELDHNRQRAQVIKDNIMQLLGE